MVALGPVVGRHVPAQHTCEHLEPLARELAAAGVPLGPGEQCPHDPDWGTWFAARAVFDVGRLRGRLDLNACVTYEEYEGRLSPADDSTFYCDCCHQAIVGLHPRSAPPGTPRLD